MTSQQNNFNRECRGSFYDKINNNWRSQITTNGKTISLGSFKTEELATQAYLDAKKIHHELP